MKNLNIKQLDEKDEEIADILISLGMSRNAAMALAYMRNTNSATSTDLEHSTRLRQPEVILGAKLQKYSCYATIYSDLSLFTASASFSPISIAFSLSASLGIPLTAIPGLIH